MILKSIKISVNTFAILLFAVAAALAISERKIDSKELAAIFKNIAEWYKVTDKYSVMVEFKSFQDYESSVAHESKSGFLKKSGRFFHSQIMGSETIQNDQYKIIIDTARNFIAIKEAEESTWDNINLDILQKGLSSAQSMTLNETGDGFQLKMAPRKSSSLSYYELNYDKLYRIKNVVLKMTKMALKEDGRTEYPIYPKVNIRFYNYSKITDQNSNEFMTSTYVDVKQEPFKGVGKYSNYKILDLRVKEKIKK